LPLVGCLYYCINDAPSHKHEIEWRVSTDLKFTNFNIYIYIYMLTLTETRIKFSLIWSRHNYPTNSAANISFFNIWR